MASNNTHGYHPVTPIDWRELLQILTAHISELGADNPSPAVNSVDVKNKTGRIANYISDLEYCLERSNNVIAYQQNILKNYARLVSVMEESRCQAYDIINRLKDEIGIAKKYHPLTDNGQEDSNE